ncbi:MAG: nucleotidyltransferase, partial [Magnetovibrio sp.]|nr:nucleotidyltransferase [Magnetovibrio sp.]
MKINTALIMCAGFGKRLNPLTLETPKPLLKIKEKTMIERNIELILKLGIKNIIINTFYLEEKITEFKKKKKFPIYINIVKDGDQILDTGGGILNMMEKSEENDFLIFNPDTFWSENYLNEIKEMENIYFTENLDNILLLVKKELSFDKTFMGDFNLKDKLIEVNGNKEFIYTGCQILNKNLLVKKKVENFSISIIWNELIKKEKLNGFNS